MKRRIFSFVTIAMVFATMCLQASFCFADESEVTAEKNVAGMAEPSDLSESEDRSSVEDEETSDAVVSIETSTTATSETFKEVPAEVSETKTTTNETEANEYAVLDGEKIKGVTQEELDEDSVMGSNINEYTNDPSTEKSSNLQLFNASKAWAKKADGQWYNGYGTAILNGAVAKGIDVSKHNGTINWSKVKAAGVDFAIIRLGFGSDYSSQDDKKLAYNVQQCEKYGIPYGFYLYSYANSSKKNSSEINHVLRLLKGTHPKYPVYYDLEDRITGKCSNDTVRNYAVNFCNKIKAAGYTPGIYASLSWWNTKLSTSKLDSFDRWVAQWNKTGCSYKRTWKLWQCADNYRVSGISGRVDLNFSYKKPSTSSSSQATKATTAATTKTAITAANKTVGWVSKNGNRYYYNSSGALVKNKWFTVSGKRYYATSSGAVYADVYKKIGDYYYGFDKSGVMYADKTAKIGGKKYMFSKSGIAYLSKIKIKKKVTKRKGPGTKYKAKGKYKKGAKTYVIQKKGKWMQTSAGVWINKKYVKVKKKYPY